MATNRWGGSSDVLMGEIIEIIEKKDCAELRALFSGQALSEAEFLDDGMAYLFMLFDGNVVSFEQRSLPSSVRTRTSGRLTFEKSDSTYIVTTENDVYLFAFSVYFIDDEKPENIGIYRIAAIRADDEEILYPWRNWEIPGIYIPDKTAE